MLELQAESLHAAAECYGGVEAEISPPEPSQPQRCLETSPGGSFVENYSAECISGADCGFCETGHKHEVCVLPERGPGPSEDRARSSPNTGRDARHAEEEPRRTAFDSAPGAHLFNRSEGAPWEPESQAPGVGIEPAAAEHSDPPEAVVQGGPEAEAGQEAAELGASVMGQNLASEGSTSEVKECGQHGELVKESPKLRGGGSPAPVAAAGDEPCPLILAADVIRARRLIEGLHEGEPPADSDSLEQKQEAAVQDYTLELEGALASQAAGPSGGGGGEADTVAELDGQNFPGCSPEVSLSNQTDSGAPMEGTCTDGPLEGSRRADPGTSCSLRATASSTTEKVEDENGWKPQENVLDVDAGFPSVPEAVLDRGTQARGTGEEAIPESSERNPGESSCADASAEAAPGESQVIGGGQEAVQPTGVSRNLHLEAADPTQDGAETTPAQRPAGESPSEDVPEPSGSAGAAVEPAASSSLTPRPTSQPLAPGTRVGAAQGERTGTGSSYTQVLQTHTHTHTKQAHQPRLCPSD